MRIFFVSLLFPLAVSSLRIVTVDPRHWPSTAAYHSAHGKNRFVVDDAVADKHAGSVLSSEPFTVSPGDFATPATAVVRFDREVTRADVVAVQAAAKTHLVYSVGNRRVSVTSPLSAAHADAVARVPHVLGVFPKRRVAKFTYASQISEFGSTAVLDAYPGTGGVIAVGDTGLDRGHCSFYDPSHAVSDAVLPVDTALGVTDSGHTKIRAYLSVCLDSGCSEMTDSQDVPDGHGTHVCGIAAGGYCPQAAFGMARASKIVFFDLNDGVDPESLEIPANVEGILQTAVVNGATSFSVSWGAGCDGTYDDVAHQFDAFVYANPTFTVVAAAGNCGGITSPASAKNVLSVGATAISPAAYAAGTRGFSAVDVAANPENYRSTKVASFSSPGPTADGRTAPLVAAPGIQVLSADAGGAAGHFNDRLMSGTSMAAPNVPKENVRQRIFNVTGVQPSSASVRAAVIVNTVPSTGVVSWGGTVLTPLPEIDPASRVGFGTIAFSSDFWFNSSSWAFVEGSLASSAAATVCFEVRYGDRVTAALAWNDPPGPFVVNPLGFVVAVTDESTVFDVGDVDNHKRLAVTPGGTSVRVTAFALGLVVNSAQPFSLVVRAASGLSPTPCPSTACSAYEPGVPCSLTNGIGFRACVSGTLDVCRPSACADGYHFDGLSCIGGAAGTTSCASGTAWNGVACECISLSRCGAADAPVVQSPSWAFWLGYVLFFIGFVVVVVLARATALDRFTLVTSSSWNLICGAFISTECIVFCGADAHWYGLWVMGTVATAMVAAHIHIVQTDTDVVISLIAVVVAFAVFIFVPSLSVLAAAVVALFVLTVFYIQYLVYFWAAAVFFYLVAVVALVDARSNPGGFTFFLVVLIAGVVSCLVAVSLSQEGKKAKLW